MQVAKADPSLLHSSRNTEIGDRFNKALFSALDALESNRIPYALIGGVASSSLGRPRSTHDIDVFVRPEDAGSALEALAAKGFATEKTDFNWLFKAFWDDILVDIIFKSKGDIYFDKEMAQRAAMMEYHGRKVKTVSPEDLVIIKAAVHDEVGPHHWHDALAVLSHATIDWDYLAKRARRAPRRLLALLVYAQSNDIWVPNRVIFDMFRTVYGDALNTSPYIPPPLSAIPGGRGYLGPGRGKPQAEPRRAPDTYLVGRLKDALARDPRTGEQDVKILVEGSRILLRGEAPSAEHRTATEDVIRDAAPGYQIDNQIKVAVLTEPEGSEDVG